tara:strand:+ start:1536 stop:1733 length:198 start_codon:yes stop_codon:yes gene_type:complete
LNYFILFYFILDTLKIIESIDTWKDKSIKLITLDLYPIAKSKIDIRINIKDILLVFDMIEIFKVY